MQNYSEHGSYLYGVGLEGVCPNHEENTWHRPAPASVVGFAPQRRQKQGDAATLVSAQVLFCDSSCFQLWFELEAVIKTRTPRPSFMFHCESTFSPCGLPCLACTHKSISFLLGDSQMLIFPLWVKAVQTKATS